LLPLLRASPLSSAPLPISTPFRTPRKSFPSSRGRVRGPRAAVYSAATSPGTQGLGPTDKTAARD
jgi:hypothetical protein